MQTGAFFYRGFLFNSLRILCLFAAKSPSIGLVAAQLVRRLFAEPSFSAVAVAIRLALKGIESVEFRVHCVDLEETDT